MPLRNSSNWVEKLGLCWPEVNVIDKFAVKGLPYRERNEVLYKEAHEQVGVGRGNVGAHDGSLGLELKGKWLGVRMNWVNWIRN